MNSNILLSICIPTYNRADCLELTLAKLQPQINRSDIEVILSDNNSSDETSIIGNKTI